MTNTEKREQAEESRLESIDIAFRDGVAWMYDELMDSGCEWGMDNILEFREALGNAVNLTYDSDAGNEAFASGAEKQFCEWKGWEV